MHGVRGLDGSMAYRVVSYRIVSIEALESTYGICVVLVSEWNGKDQGKAMYGMVRLLLHLCRVFKF
jgi:hypothetical protein